MLPWWTILIAFFLLATAPVSFKLSYGNKSLPFRVRLDSDGVIEVRLSG